MSGRSTKTSSPGTLSSLSDIGARSEVERDVALVQTLLHPPTLRLANMLYILILLTAQQLDACGNHEEARWVIDSGYAPRTAQLVVGLDSFGEDEMQSVRQWERHIFPEC